MFTYTSIYNTLMCIFLCAFGLILLYLFVYFLATGVGVVTLSVGWLPLELLGQMKPTVC